MVNVNRYGGVCNNEEPLYKLAKEIHDNAVSHGWWDEPRNLLEIVG